MPSFQAKLEKKYSIYLKKYSKGQKMPQGQNHNDYDDDEVQCLLACLLPALFAGAPTLAIGIVASWLSRLYQRQLPSITQCTHGILIQKCNHPGDGDQD